MFKSLVMRPTVYVVILISSLIATYGYKLRTEGIFACQALADASDGYLAYCNARAYGDYDHGALWFSMEPEVGRLAAKADVLFLGNSRLEFGFSSAATDEWFAGAGASHYLLGFSHLENETFIGPLLTKLKPQAKVYVINVDRFFDDEESAPGGEILHGSDMKRRYSEKRLWQRVQRPLCTQQPRLCGKELAFYRLRENGHWQHKGGGLDQPLAIADAPPSEQDRWDHYAALAKQFILTLPVDSACVILTVIPSPATKRAEARAIAKAVGLDLLAPELEGLQTFDDTHLNPASAQRWSAAFFEVAGPRIQRCLNSTGVAAAG